MGFWIGRTPPRLPSRATKSFFGRVGTAIGPAASYQQERGPSNMIPAAFPTKQRRRVVGSEMVRGSAAVSKTERAELERDNDESRSTP
jgi:hypothetical protein